MPQGKKSRKRRSREQLAGLARQFFKNDNLSPENLSNEGGQLFVIGHAKQILAKEEKKSRPDSNRVANLKALIGGLSAEDTEGRKRVGKKERIIATSRDRSAKRFKRARARGKKRGEGKPLRRQMNADSKAVEKAMDRRDAAGKRR